MESQYAVRPVRQRTHVPQDGKLHDELAFDVIGVTLSSFSRRMMR